MTTTRNVCLTVLCLCLMKATTVAGQQCRSVRVANVKSIFAIAPSPVGMNVLLYGSAEEAEGEIVRGSLFWLRLSGAKTNVSQLEAPDASNPSSPVWKGDGSAAYFETDNGVYQLGLAVGSPELLWRGRSVGMAISPDGHRLAFWLVERGVDTLMVYDLSRHSEARTWKVPDRFESDKSGWDLAFASDNRSLYARTYDEANSTPLKRFDLASGEVEVVSPDSYAVAEGKDAVYFISSSHGRRSLHKIVNATSRPILVATNFGYDSLSTGGNPRWLVSQDDRTTETAILDTETDTIKSTGKHESTAVLLDGRLLVANGSQIVIGDASCAPRERTEESSPRSSVESHSSG